MDAQTIINLLLGTGTLAFIGTMIKLFVIDKKKSDVEVEGRQIENQKDKVELSDAETEQISKSMSVVKNLLKDAEESAELARTVKKENDKLKFDNDKMSSELEVRSGIIEYQKNERRDWMEMLQTTLAANAKREKEFEILTHNVEELKKTEQNCQENLKEQAKNVAGLEGRLNVLVGILQKNKLEMPEGFIWTNSANNQVYPNGENKAKQ